MQDQPPDTARALTSPRANGHAFAGAVLHSMAHGTARQSWLPLRLPACAEFTNAHSNPLMLSTVACMNAVDGNMHRARETLHMFACGLWAGCAEIDHYVSTCSSLRKPAGIKHVIRLPCACLLLDSPNAPGCAGRLTRPGARRRLRLCPLGRHPRQGPLCCCRR